MTPQDAAQFFLQRILSSFPDSQLYEDYKADATDGFTDAEYDLAYAVLYGFAEGILLADVRPQLREEVCLPFSMS
jgi:hypothetical protein